jgi:large subunit ribosomal protein L13
LIKKNPTAIVEKAVKGMLPKSRLGSDLFRNLYVYEGSEHPHQGQKPKEFKVNN